MNKLKKACISAVLAAVLALSSCTTQPNEVHVSAKAQQIADSFFSGSRGSYPAWDDTDRAALAAYVTGTDDDAFFNITFGDFFSEYMYHLVLYRIDDDMSDANKSVCEGYRESIMTYLTFERMYLYTAEKEYGISEETLSEVQKKEIRETADTVRKNSAAAFYTSASAMLGENADENSIEELCNEVLEAVLQKCGLDSDIFYKWEMIKYIEELMLSEAVKNSAVTDADVEAAYGNFLDAAKAAAAEDPAGYDKNTVYMSVFVPEGSRKADILFFGSGTSAEKAEKSAAAAGKLTAGEDAAAVAEEYGATPTVGAVVLRESTAYPQKVRDALYALTDVGSVSEPVECTGGVFVIRYAGSAEITDEAAANIKSDLRAQLESNKENTVQSRIYSQWAEKYNYTINYDLLKLQKEKGNDNG